MIKLIGKILMTIFLIICVAVHVRGVMAPFSQEPLWSHMIHIVSYSICLVSILRPFSWAWVAYTIGAIYPFLYHSRCAWMEYNINGRFSPVCILVIILLPAGIALVWPKSLAKQE